MNIFHLLKGKVYILRDYIIIILIFFEAYNDHFEIYMKTRKNICNRSSVNNHHINPFKLLHAFFVSIFTFTSCDRYIFCLLQKQGKVVEKLLKEIIKNTGGELDVK